MRFNEHLSKISGVVKPVVCVSTIIGFNSVSVMNNSPRRVGLVIFLIAYKNDELAERNLVESNLVSIRTHIIGLLSRDRSLKRRSLVVDSSRLVTGCCVCVLQVFLSV